MRRIRGIFFCKWPLAGLLFFVFILEVFLPLDILASQINGNPPNDTAISEHNNNSRLYGKGISKIAPNIEKYLREYARSFANEMELEILMIGRMKNSTLSVAVVHASLFRYTADSTKAIITYLFDDSNNEFGMLIDYEIYHVMSNNPPYHYHFTLEEFDNDHLVIIRHDPEYGMILRKFKYDFDLHNKTLINKHVYDDIEIYNINSENDKLYLLASQGSKDFYYFYVLSPIKGSLLGDCTPELYLTHSMYPYDKSLKNTEGGLTFLSRDAATIYEKDHKGAKIWPVKSDSALYYLAGDKRFNMPYAPEGIGEDYRVEDGHISIRKTAKYPTIKSSKKVSYKGFKEFPSNVIEDSEHEGFINYFLPQPKLDFVMKQRPHALGDTAEHLIGPYWVEDDKIWFGLSYAENDGYTGIGGIGYFDLNSKNYYINYLKEIIDWSSSAIYKDGDLIYLGASTMSDDYVIPGGIFRYNLKSSELNIYRIPSFTYNIYKHDGKFYIGANNGFYILTNYSIYFVAIHPEGHGYNECAFSLKEEIYNCIRVPESGIYNCSSATK